MSGVDIWCVHLDVDEASTARFETFLSVDEQLTAGSYRFALDRRRFIVRRGRLRELLARTLDCSAHDVRIVTDAFGKPRVEGAAVTFSLSHSRGKALYAFASGPEIGCDIELRDANAATRDAAELFLSPREIQSLPALSASQWTERFFRCWTCKEAWLKARGVGLTISMRTITVSADGPLRFLELPDDDPSQWSLNAFDLPDGYVGTVAVRGPAPVMRFPHDVIPAKAGTQERNFIRKGQPSGSPLPRG